VIRVGWSACVPARVGTAGWVAEPWLELWLRSRSEPACRLRLVEGRFERRVLMLLWGCSTVGCYWATAQVPKSP